VQYIHIIFIQVVRLLGSTRTHVFVYVFIYIYIYMYSVASEGRKLHPLRGIHPALTHPKGSVGPGNGGWPAAITTCNDT